jgi:translation initiation factor IF-3
LKTQELKLRINKEIKTPQIRLIDAENKMIGVVPIAQGLALADETGLDLVEISPNAQPPVCKVADYGKMLFNSQKKNINEKKKQKILVVKEIKMSPNIGQNDYETKIKQVRNFLEKEYTVKFSFIFKGREIQHSHLIQDLIAKIIEETKDIAKIDLKPKMEGKRLFFVLSSNKEKPKNA